VNELPVPAKGHGVVILGTSADKRQYVLVGATSLSFHLRSGLPSGLLSSLRSPKPYTHFSSPLHATYPAHFILLDLIILLIFDHPVNI